MSIGTHLSRVMGAANVALRRWSFNSRRADFYDDMADALADKVDVAEFLEKRRGRARRRGSSDVHVLSLWINRLNSMPFSSAIATTVPAIDVSVISAAEASGELVNGLRFLSTTLRGVSKMARTVRKAVATPIVLMIIMTALMVGFSWYMVPILTQMISPDKWPPVSKALYAASNLITKHGVVVGIGLVGVAAVLTWSLDNWTGKYRLAADRFLPWSIYRSYHGAVFLISLSAMMSARIDLVDALRKIRSTSDTWVRWHISRMLAKLDSDSDRPGRAINTGILPPYIADRVVDASERSSFHQIIEKVGNQAIEQTEEFVETASAVLNRVLLLVAAATLLFIIAGFMLVAIEVQSTIRSSGGRL